MKNLANCTPTEFFKQAYRTKKAAEKWMKKNGILEIRSRMPELVKITDTMTKEEATEAFKENQKRIKKAAFDNSMEILDKALGEDPEGTLEILALCFFIEPAEVDNYKVRDYLRGITELIKDPDVIGFFTSVAQLEQTVSPTASTT